MKTIILLFHPNLTQSRVNATLASYAKKNADVVIRDEYALYPDGKIDVAAEQAAVADFERIVFQFPTYWYSAPSLLKVWEDEVLTPGWSYAGGTALKDKHYMVATSQGASPASYTKDGRYHMTTADMLKPYQALQYLTQMVWEQPFAIQGVANLDDEALHQAAEKYVARLQK